jgi:hypothetical protein
MKTDGKSLYSLIPLEDFKAILGIDDREDKLARFCLVTGTFTIEQYCKRRFLRKKHLERIEYTGDLFLPLREYPVISMSNEQLEMSNGEKINPKSYRIIPDCGSNMEFPYLIELSPTLQTYLDFHKRQKLFAIKIVYWAGYVCKEQLAMSNEQRKNAVPADLAAACLELAAWNMNRYRGRRVGMTGNIRGAGKEGEHFEMSMPENVKVLIEPYRRKTI